MSDLHGPGRFAAGVALVRSLVRKNAERDRWHDLMEPVDSVRRDPDTIVEEVNQQGWFVTMNGNMHPDLVEHAKHAKDRTQTLS